MKAHRRNGIPTLMLQTGGSTRPDPISEWLRTFLFRPREQLLQPRELPKSPAGRRFYIPGIPGGDETRSLESRESDSSEESMLAESIKRSQSFDRAESLIRSQFVRDLAPQLSAVFKDISADDYKTFKQAISPIAGLRSLGKNTPGRRREDYIPFSALKNRDPRPEYRDELASVVGNLSRLPEGFVPQIVGPLKQSLESELSRLSPRLGSPAPGYESVQEALLESAKSSSEAAAEAARQEQESAAAPQPPETPAGTEATPAGTAATPAATVAPEIPEAEALRQATGAPTQAEEAAATADKNGAPTPTTNPTVVTSIQSTISDIMGGEEAQFDEGKRLQELKEKFGLGISDMEKAAPGLAFAFSLMGAQRAPGESPFNALVRAAGSAGEAATKSNLALKQRERAIDSSLASTVLGEKKAAEQYARSKEWVALWNGGFDERGVPQAEYLRMNADQIQKANDAGLQIVPVNVVSSATTAFATRSKAGVEARTELIKQMQAAGKGTSTSISIGGEDVKATSFQSADGKTFVIPDDVAGVANTLNSTIKDTAETISLIGELRSLAPGVARFRNVGAAGVGRVASLFGMSKEDELSPEQFAQAAYAKANSAWNVESLRGLMSKTDASKVSSEMSREDIGKYFGQDAADAYDDKEKLNSIISKKLPKLTAVSQMPERVENEDKTAYEKRVRFKAIQNALAAQLAPILLGESGRTISDADRVRVIALLGGFADFSKAGVLTTEEEMNQSINELERIIRKYQSSSKQDAETFLTRLDEASRSPSYSGMRGYIYTPDRATSMAVGSLAQNYEKAFPKETPGQSSGATTMKSSEL
jgi:hypothetical protein